ncbi:MAG TPA: C25 family cysteine peptidase, partial [Bacteroidales bacterium]|nr:C25 family cysteine peptidase [Bacteroidales bacterium]
MAGEIRLNNNKPEVRYTKGSQLSFTFRTNLPSVQFREVNTRAGVFTELFAEGYGWGNSVGDPKLPVYHKMIQLPLGAGFNIRITKVSYRDVDLAGYGILNPVIPAQAPVSKNTTDPGQLPFVYNQATYQLDQWLGGPLVTVTPAGILRSVDLGRLDIAPVQYNPVTNRLRVYESIEATVEFTHPDLAATQALEQRTWSPYFNNIYAQLPNYSPQNPDTLITGGPVTMVIVAPRMFHDSLQKLVRWKIRKGFHVIQGYTDDPGVGSTTTSIRNFLMNLYNNPPAGYAPPSFVLLVGDVTEIPTFTPSGHPSDLHYCEYTGDNIPEVYYGRFSASTAGQLQPYIDKSVEYEEYQIPDDAFLGEATMVAGADATNGPLYGNGQINYGTSTYFNSAHNILSHTYLQPEPPNGNYSQQIRQNVSDGVSFANYTAHGSEQGWADPQFVISQIPPLQNDHKYCLMVGNCCKTSNFGLDCFAEEVVRAAHKGAVGYIGCSDYSYWDEDYWWAIGFKTVTTNPAYDPNHLGAYDVTFHDHGESQDHWYVTLGQMITGGDLAVEESTSGIKQYYWETYCLMGDPSLSIYQFVPSQLNATYSNVLPVGATSLTVTTEPWAYVALTVNDTIILDARTSDATGIVNLSFSPLTATGNLSLTGTKQDRKPYFGTIQVIPGNQPWVILSSFTVDDSVGGNNDHDADYGEAIRLNVTVTNLGTVPCSNATGTLSTPDTNVLITENTECFGSIPAGGTVTAHDAFSVSIHTNVTDQHVVVFNLEISDGTHSWNSDLDLVLNAPSLAIGNYYILDPPPGGNNNGILDPGESATLKVRVINQGHAPVNNAVAHLSVLPGSAPYILVTDPNYYIGTLNVNSLVFSYTGIVSNGITPVGTNVELNDVLTAGSQGQYFAQKEIDLEIGDVPDYYMANGTVTTCSANFYDSGGPLSNYSDNESYTMTFYPGTSGAEVQAGFTQFDVEPQANCDYDWLKIYDGSSTSGTLLGTYCGTTSPGVVTSTTGALTFNFHSDYSDNYSGWSADLSCIG